MTRVNFDRVLDRTPYLVFLAGSIASGKSSVRRMLSDLGANCLSLDDIGHDLLHKDDKVKTQIVAQFGDEVYDRASQSIKRDVLADKVFGPDEAAAARLAQLEAIMLPAIKAALLDKLKTLDISSCRICVVEVPLLHKVEDLLDTPDEILVIDAPFGLRLERAQERGMSRDDFIGRSQHQASAAWLADHADTIIINTRSVDALALQVQAWWESHEDLWS
ncbi:dephospho-CoA kinase [Atopobium deltae]|uniref:Dephospho-CoA kinase n=1 Tax=Atopobium deltae TaxID=1393034 RepID=A0A133XXJ0_9ACTN|nr:dephospho-CoA kinase [Atopobium deltae]KXB35651.1 dephospho-CoA kinase [Atopobium deltae]